MDEQMKPFMQTAKESRRRDQRIALDDVGGDFLTHKEFVAWSGLSRNAAYEVLRQEPYRQAVRRFGRQIRISKKALSKVIEEGS
jgi:hypothetical protein